MSNFEESSYNDKKYSEKKGDNDIDKFLNHEY
jgi:hypothetical protein